MKQPTAWPLLRWPLDPAVLLAAGACLLALLAAGPAGAQDKVLREKDLTPQALIDALAPPAPAATAAEPAAAGDEEPGMRTRSFRPVIRPAAAAATPAAGAVAAGAADAPAGRASILITFVTDSAQLTPRAKTALAVLAAAMQSERLSSTRFTIEGHADPRGGEAHNLKLSQARAESVRAHLLDNHGLQAERITAVGKGATALLNPRNPAAEENRRVTIVAQP